MSVRIGPRSGGASTSTLASAFRSPLVEARTRNGTAPAVAGMYGSTAFHRSSSPFHVCVADATAIPCSSATIVVVRPRSPRVRTNADTVTAWPATRVADTDVRSIVTPGALAVRSST